VLALIIYGTILFPSAHELIDYAAIDVFSGGSLWRPAGATTPPITKCWGYCPQNVGTPNKKAQDPPLDVFPAYGDNGENLM